MIIPNEVLLSVVFIGVRKDGKYSWGGTGFFVTIQSDEIQMMHNLYLVTARHVVEQLQGRNTCLRISGVDEPFHEIELEPPPRWYFHPTDPFADVAVIPWQVAQLHIGDIDLKCVPLSMFLGPDLRSAEMPLTHQTNLGNDVFIVGLFREHSGTKKNLPIVRSGHVAMVPEEPIPIKISDQIRGETNAYLVETRSIGGMSGSPAFVLGEPEQYDPQAGKSERILGLPMQTRRRLYFLGLVHGHWGVDAVIHNLEFRKENGEGINVGMANIVPAYKILETLNQDALLELRKKNEREAIDPPIFREGETL